MDFFGLVAVIAVIAIGFSSSKSSKLAGSNTVILWTVFISVVVGVGALSGINPARLLSFIGLAILIILGWVFFSSDNKEKETDDSAK